MDYLLSTWNSMKIKLSLSLHLYGTQLNTFPSLHMSLYLDSSILTQQCAHNSYSKYFFVEFWQYVMFSSL